MRPVSTRGQGLAHHASHRTPSSNGLQHPLSQLLPLLNGRSDQSKPPGSLGVTREAMLGAWHPANTPAGTGAGRVMPRAQLPAHSCRLSTHSTTGSLPFVMEGSLRAGAMGALETSGSDDAHF